MGPLSFDSPLLTRDQARSLDALAAERHGLPGVVLMENAGAGAVEVLLAADPELKACSGAGRAGAAAPETPPVAGAAADATTAIHRAAVAILCGKGNNAGDGFVVGRRLAQAGIPTAVVLLSPPRELAVDALTNYRLLVATTVAIADLSATSPLELPQRLDQCAGGARWLVDALLGSGAQGAPREPLHTAIHWMNAQGSRRLALDLPSGLDCDTGATPGAVVRAEITCTFVAPKRGFASAEAAAYVGAVHVVPIGTPPELLVEVLGS